MRSTLRLKYPAPFVAYRGRVACGGSREVNRIYRSRGFPADENDEFRLPTRLHNFDDAESRGGTIASFRRL